MIAQTHTFPSLSGTFGIHTRLAPALLDLYNDGMRWW